MNEDKCGGGRTVARAHTHVSTAAAAAQGSQVVRAKCRL